MLAYIAIKCKQIVIAVEDPAVFDGRDGGLRDACQLGKLALAQFLKFAQDANRLADRDFNSLLGLTVAVTGEPNASVMDQPPSPVCQKPAEI